jgi:hypothetical protein
MWEHRQLRIMLAPPLERKHTLDDDDDDDDAPGFTGSS